MDNNCTLTKLVEIVGYAKSNQGKLAKRLLLQHRGDVVAVQKGRNGDTTRPWQIWFKPEKFEYICSKQRAPQPSNRPGHVYGYEMKLHRGCYKFGKSTNIRKRLNGYHGHNTPGDIVLMYASDNLDRKEAELLSFIRNCGHFEQLSVGREWFKTALSSDKVRCVVNAWKTLTEYS